MTALFNVQSTKAGSIMLALGLGNTVSDAARKFKHKTRTAVTDAAQSNLVVESDKSRLDRRSLHILCHVHR
eukprot:31916-Pyramimonas_sp.AAC.1